MKPLTFRTPQLQIRLSRLVVTCIASKETRFRRGVPAEKDRLQDGGEDFNRGAEVSGELLPIGADGGHFALGEVEDRRRNPAVADVGLRLHCSGRGLEEHRPGGFRSNRRERERLVEGLEDNLRDHAGRRGGYGGGEEGEEGGEEDSAWGVHFGRVMQVG